MKTNLLEMAIARKYQQFDSAIEDIAESAFKYDDLYVYEFEGNEYLFIDFDAVSKIIKNSKELEDVVNSNKRLFKRIYNIEKELELRKDTDYYFSGEFADDIEKLLNRSTLAYKSLKEFCEYIYDEVCKFNYRDQGVDASQAGYNLLCWKCSSYRNGSITKGKQEMISSLEKSFYNICVEIRGELNKRQEYSPIKPDRNLNFAGICFYFDTFVKSFYDESDADDELQSLIRTSQNNSTIFNDGIKTSSNGNKYLNFIQRLSVDNTTTKVFLNLNAIIYSSFKSTVRYEFRLTTDED